MVDNSIFSVFLKKLYVARQHHPAIIVQPLKTTGRLAKVAVCSRTRAFGLSCPRLIWDLGEFCVTEWNAKGGGSINGLWETTTQIPARIGFAHSYLTKL